MNRMTNLSFLLVGYASIFAIPGCARDAPDDGTEQTDVAEAEAIQGPGGVGANTIGQFHVIKLSNTSLCLQPVAGSTGDVNIELATCAFTLPAQNWLFVAKAGRWEVVNAQSGKCLYGPDPATSGNGPIMHGGCDVSTSPRHSCLQRVVEAVQPHELLVDPVVRRASRHRVLRPRLEHHPSGPVGSG
jgi:hypothetical protein